jgi:uncharacterized protein YndB with AHSA1/START domain
MAGNPDVVTVERVIGAPASQIFALLADPERHNEIDGSGTVRGAKESSQVLTLGSRFTMAMQSGVPYSMVNAWQTRPAIAPLALFVGGRIWRYELEPVAGGTRVRESWDITNERVKAAVRPLRSQTRKSMENTLARVEAVLTNR